ncbi:Uncharacterized protein OS=Pirellula staleyi (strain ATCC 27377 / DSM 6068 / ICPB 4128) GN=Psta_1297 PE=4 SV=1 [Gemmata massiliana]|uniref:Glycosyltransferase 2-like domain-containing protein n=1 Tax=Gemmata massiliana TaxID=1210884 RepID=A0A6P2CY24_9BACT|nr:hypothetical protein [Gemmata massiliana]VTR92032.1 Uncharacterized protein OS=Pirellula staleyi (strain ATCC 27377 / DSM 6068 / ICPB 4128) GN=Psta_1297 PE=4 SV=1 [Gemmata massiliana]
MSCWSRWAGIEPGCEGALRELERRGCPVWRYRGYSAVDAARNQMASGALGAGFAELMWIDADVVFEPDDVDRLRAHDRPFTCGLYPKKGPREFACEFLLGTPVARFGTRGGLVEVRYCGFGFAHVRKGVLVAVHHKLQLPVCNRRFGTPLVPFFQPLVVGEPSGPWSLSEDYVFCERGAVRVPGGGRHVDPVVARRGVPVRVGGRGKPPLSRFRLHVRGVRRPG